MTRFDGQAPLRGSHLGILLPTLCIAVACAGAGIATFHTERTASTFLILTSLACGLLAYAQGALSRKLGADIAKWAAEARLQSMAFRFDNVSGGLTRTAFIDDCDTQLLADRGPGAFLLLMDLDHLKRINDAHGHGKGDFALRHFSSIARAQSPGSLFGRLGGDEFAMLVIPQSPVDPVEFANRLLRSLGKTVWHDQQPMNLSASIGIALVQEGCASFDALTHRADLALYEAKRNGRAQATLFVQDMMRDHRYARAIERELRAAVLLNELSLSYQPFFHGDGQLCGYQAEARWEHPLRGTIAPDEFIPIAERTVLIDLLGEWVIRHACRQMASMAGTLLAIDVSASQLKRDTLVVTVREAIKETGISPKRLVLQLTEGGDLSARSDLHRRVEVLREMGVRVALGNFAGKHTGLANLRSCPVDAIKIDHSLVARLGQDPLHNVLVTALINIAHACGLPVAVGGIETQEQFLLAKAAGADIFQGLYLAGAETLQAETLSVVRAQPASFATAPSLRLLA
ncbi:MAG: EAL domain-containing protein [Pseudomonadota bacterium]|nr:EAL domain-containing protein [Pseudomonadota bacterium]